MINCAEILTGDIYHPRLEADTLVISDGKIERVGKRSECDLSRVDEVWDLGGMTLIPGLIDAHGHPSVGDWTPRQSIIGWMAGTLNGGVTTLVSVGEMRMEELPDDPAGVKALAILAARTYRKLRPGGMKVRAGAVWLVEGLAEDDFREMADSGVHAVAEVGTGEMPDIEVLLPMVDAARRHGLKIPLHSGGRRKPGMVALGLDFLEKIKPDVVCHLSGGPTPSPWSDIASIVVDTDYYIEVCYSGNPRVTVDIVALAAERGQLHRVMIGSDTPSSIGIVPIAIPRTMSFISSLTDVPPEQVVAMATGNTARAYGLSTGILEPGRDADLLVLEVPVSSWGSSPADAIQVGENISIAAIFVDGKLITRAPRNTQPATRQIERVE
ncbi:MAG: amidohydrolase family protein [Chloroflexi bacterium]|nr:amidohydrolase family protein [Chloroflexota bacterium]